MLLWATLNPVLNKWGINEQLTNKFILSSKFLLDIEYISVIALSPVDMSAIHTGHYALLMHDSCLINIIVYLSIIRMPSLANNTYKVGLLDWNDIWIKRRNTVTLKTQCNLLIFINSEHTNFLQTNCNFLEC